MVIIMNLWFYMLFIDLLLPIIMFMSSFIFVAGGPKNINNIFGYRTGWSMINKDTWAFAHEFCEALNQIRRGIYFGIRYNYALPD